MHLSPIGQIIAYEWKRTERIHPYVSLDEWIVMPNHIHGIINLHPGEGVVETSRSNPQNKQKTSDLQVVLSHQNLRQRDVSTEEPRLKADSLGAIIGQIKSVYTKRIRSKGFCDFGWQAGYYDPIIRDNKELDRIREYINGNPQKWDNDEENPEKLKPKYRCPLQAH